MLIPPNAPPGSTIAITCPAGAVEPGEQDEAVSFLKARGYHVIVGSTVGSSYYRFSATDDERRTELQSFLDDPSIDVILCGRGGYGTMRIIEGLSLEKFSSKPKWLVGFSDITCLHSYIHRHTGIATVHGHMLKGFQMQHTDFLSTENLMFILQGSIPTYFWTCESEQEVEVQGKLVGGNLAILSDLVGTIADIDTDGAILFVEDVSEYYYNIDRMMMQLKLAGKLNKLSAILVGAFTDLKDNEIPFGETVEDIMRRVTNEYGIPVVSNFAAGHQLENLPLVLGLEYTLSQSERKCSLQYLRPNV